MKKLKNTSLPNKIIFILLIILLLRITTYQNKESLYNINETNFNLKITDYKIDDNKITLTLKGKENLIGNYYFKNDNDKEIINKIEYGSTINIKGILKEPSNNTIPNTFNYKKYLNNKNIFYTLTISNIESIKKPKNILYIIKNKINKRINKIDKKGYIKSFILGDKSNIDNNIYKCYQNNGISHLFALSGMHISLIIIIIEKVTKKLNIKIQTIIEIIILITYGFIVNFPSSIKRCLLFFIINKIFKLLKIEIESIKVLLIVILILLIYDYKIIYDTGFLYSITTVGGILLSQSIINDNKIKSSIKLSIIAFLFSLPISLYTFYSINILSIIYNLFYIPFISIIIYPLTLLTFIIPILNPILNIFISILEKSILIINKIDIFTIHLNLNTYEIILYYIILIITIKYKKYYLYILNIIIIMIDILIPYIDNNTYIYYLDVNQGDSTLIITKNKKETILIDTGGIKNNNNKLNEIISFLYSKGINKIDYLILTHGDYDHMGWSYELINNIKINKVIFNCGEFNELEQNLINILNKKKISYYSCIKTLNTYDNNIYFLQTKEYDNENDNSNVIYTEINNYKFLFMGDASVEVEQNLIEKYNLKNIDVLKVGHHGSKTSSSKTFIDETTPKYSIISVGKNNIYKHPNKEVLNTLEKSTIYRTDQDGSIIFKIKKNKLQIKTYKP